jgi:hypothetical protein
MGPKLQVGDQGECRVRSPRWKADQSGDFMQGFKVCDKMPRPISEQKWLEIKSWFILGLSLPIETAQINVAT